MADDTASPDLDCIVRDVREIAAQVKALSKIAPAMEQLDARQAQMITDITQLKATVGSLSLTETGHGGNSVSSEERATPAEDRLLKKIVDRSRALYPLLQWFIKMTVVSMVEGFPVLEQWMKPSLLAQLSKVRRDLVGVSGLAVILFSVDPSDEKVMYRMSTGPVWTFVVRCVFANMVHSARQQLFRSPEDEPRWLADLGEPVQIFAILSARLADFNTLRDLPHDFGLLNSGPSTKKRRVEDSTDSDSVAHDQFLQTTLIRRLKRSVCRHLTYCRHEVKVYLFEKILFLVSMIRARGGPVRAMDHGFRFIFTDPSEEEAHPTGGADHSLVELWNLSRNEVPMSEEAIGEADAMNEEYVHDLERRFPYLKVQLEWRRRVVHGEEDRDRDDAEYHNSDLWWPATESVSLVKVAGGIFLELVRVRSLVTVMRCSEYSAMAIFVLALGLRGLLRDTLGMPMTNAERVAKGSVFAVMREKNDNFVSVLLPNAEPACAPESGERSDLESRDASIGASDGNRSSQGEASASPGRDSQRLAKAKKSRSTVSWNTYVCERNKGMSVFAAEEAEREKQTKAPAGAVQCTADPEIELLGPQLNAPTSAFLYIPGDD